MKKRALALILTLVMMTSATAGFTAFAEEPDQNFTEVAVCSADNQRKVERMVEKTNQAILLMVKAAQLTSKNDVDKLVEKTNKLAFKTIEKAAELGVTVVCEYVAFEVDGQIVYIDPLRIINR